MDSRELNCAIGPTPIVRPVFLHFGFFQNRIGITP
jgi:hypothetical protein